MMGNLSMLLELRLNDNALTGNIPTMLGRLGDLGKLLNSSGDLRDAILLNDDVLIDQLQKQCS